MTEAEHYSSGKREILKIRIGYTPFENKDNAYTERSIEILSRLGEVCSAPTLRELLRNPLSFKPRSYDFIVANWVENSIINNKGGISAIGVFKLAVNILLMKALSKKTIFVRHNNYPHNSSPKAGPRAARIIDVVEMFFDYVITHSGHNETPKRFYIPHPLYKKFCVKNEKQRQKENYYLVFGRMLPYKKIEKLIQAIPSHIALVIAGSAPDKRYLEKLQIVSKEKKIKLMPGFISDENAADLAKSSRGIVITHNDDDMIVSGTFFFALSHGVPIYSVSNPFTQWAEKKLKVPSLHVSNDIPILCKRLEYDATQPQEYSMRDQEKIEHLFGDVAIENKWLEILHKSDKNSKMRSN